MRMLTKFAAVGAAAVMAVACNQSMESTTAPSALPGAGATLGQAQTGNGAPSGSHFNLNLIGVQKGKTADLSGNNGRRIFIWYDAKTPIYLREGDFQVIDANGTDGDGASFQLPNPDDGSGDLAYSVWVRPVAGKGDISFASCFTEFETNSTWCYAGNLVQNLTKNNKFTDVSRDLLQVCADTDTTAGTNLQLVPLFSDLGQDYWWEVDNNGMRNTQLRFYPIKRAGLEFAPGQPVRRRRPPHPPVCSDRTPSRVRCAGIHPRARCRAGAIQRRRGSPVCVRSSCCCLLSRSRRRARVRYRPSQLASWAAAVGPRCRSRRPASSRTGWPTLLDPTRYRPETHLPKAK